MTGILKLLSKRSYSKMARYFCLLRFTKKSSISFENVKISWRVWEFEIDRSNSRLVNKVVWKVTLLSPVQYILNEFSSLAWFAKKSVILRVLSFDTHEQKF